MVWGSIIFTLFLLANTVSTLLEAKISPDDALRALMTGNQRFVNEQTVCPSRTEERRLELLHKQNPIACIVGCSDSRLTPEIIFDQGVGDLFVVRIAGNVVGPLGINSVEYAVKVLQASVLMVLGHANCGAVAAVIDGKGQGIPKIAEMIEPSVKKAKEQPGNLLVNAIKANVQNTVQRLMQSPAVRTAVDKKELKVVGGYYNMETGLVELLR